MRALHLGANAMHDAGDARIIGQAISSGLCGQRQVIDRSSLNRVPYQSGVHDCNHEQCGRADQLYPIDRVTAKHAHS